MMAEDDQSPDFVNARTSAAPRCASCCREPLRPQARNDAMSLTSMPSAALRVLRQISCVLLGIATSAAVKFICR